MNQLDFEENENEHINVKMINSEKRLFRKEDVKEIISDHWSFFDTAGEAFFYVEDIRLLCNGMVFDLLELESSQNKQYTWCWCKGADNEYEGLPFPHETHCPCLVSFDLMRDIADWVYEKGEFIYTADYIDSIGKGE